MSKRLTVKSNLQQALAVVEDLISQADSSEQHNKLVKLKEKIVESINGIDEDHKNRGKHDDGDFLNEKTFNRVTQILKLVIKVIGLHDHLF